MKVISIGFTLTLILACFSAATEAPAKGAGGEKVMLFSYFLGNGESGVHLKVSENGLHFENLNDGDAVFNPPETWPEDQQLTRDPSIVYHEGTFHMVWTTNWEGRYFGYTSSEDLVNWSDPVIVTPFPEDLPDEEQPNNVWAPELHYDPVNDDFFVIFSSTIPRMLEEGTPGIDTHGNNHRMYIVRTRDFESFSDAEVFYNPGFSSIDGHLFYEEYGSPEVDDDRWVMVFKHERLPEFGGKNIRLAFKNPVTGAFSDYSEPIVGPGSPINEHWAEGPTLVRDLEGIWNLYWDSYSAGYYALSRSTDLKNWWDASGKLKFETDRHPRHGTFLYVPKQAIGW